MGSISCLIALGADTQTQTHRHTDTDTQTQTHTHTDTHMQAHTHTDVCTETILRNQVPGLKTSKSN